MNRQHRQGQWHMGKEEGLDKLCLLVLVIVWEGGVSHLHLAPFKAKAPSLHVAPFLPSLLRARDI